MRVDLFKPPNFIRRPLNIKGLSECSGKQYQYATSGKASLFHILKSFDIPKKILIPAYICDSVLIPLERLNIEPLFYDIDLDDLNGSVDSIDRLVKKYEVKCVLLASLYGNPANLSEIERYCSENNIKLIDDAAQSFGAHLDGRCVGTFGNAGFFSFSPGKATAGHMGSFFWTEETYCFKQTKHFWCHYVIWLDFYFNRYKCYSSNFLLYKNFINILTRLCLRYFDLYYDKISRFEESILGGILNGVLTEMKTFRIKYFREFYNEFSNNSLFRIIKAKRGVPNNHKIVLIFHNSRLAEIFISFCKEKKLLIGKGYKLFAKKSSEIANAIAIENRVVELPIEDNKERMEYLFNVVKDALKIFRAYP